MAKLIINKSLLDKEILLEKETREDTLSKAIYSCREVQGLFVVAKVNETLIPVEDWHLFKLNTFDRVQLTARPQQGALPYIGAVVGAIIGAVGGGPAGAGYGAAWGAALGAIKGAFIGYSLGSMADALFFPPSIPNVQLYTDDGTATTNPNYGWDGARIVTQPGGPKTVLYGQHRISGALIMQHVSSDGERNYLNMLINLGQGEIEGVMKADGLGICTSETPTGETDTSGSVGVADVDDYYASGTNVDTGTFSGVASYTRYLVVNGVMRGAYITWDGVRAEYSHIYARPVLNYKYIGEWHQEQGTYTYLRHDTDYTFQFTIDMTTLKYDITDFYVTFDYNTFTPVYKVLFEEPLTEYNKFYEYLHLTTYVATSYLFDSPDIEINGQPFMYFENTSWQYRLGTYDQSIIDEFHETQTYYGDGRKAENVVIYTSSGITIDGFEVQITCPLLFLQDPSGNIVDNTVSYQIEYKLAAAGTWTDGGSFSITDVSKTIIYKYHKYNGLTVGQYNIRLSRRTPVFSSFKKAGDIHLGGVTEIVTESIAYRNSALISLRLMANDQLSNTTPNITALVRGLKILVPKLTIGGVTQTYDECYWNDSAGRYERLSDGSPCTDTGTYVRQWSRNPIWCSRDFILNKRYGLGNYIDDSSFNDAAAAIEAKYCWELVTDFDGGTEHRFEMDLPISSFMSAQEALKVLARCFRGWFIWSNGTYKPVIDREQDPVQLFNGSNIKPGSMKTNYLKASQTPNIVEIQYANPDRDYTLDPIEIVDTAEWTSVKPPRPHAINAIGSVRRSQNIRDGKYYLNCAKYCTKVQEFISPGDAIHCEPGDTIRLQDDLLAWGVGGRIVAATSNSITTNIDITYSAGYEVRVRLPDFTLETKTVTSVTNNNRTLNISGSFTATPLIDSVFTYGSSGVDSKPFKVKTITRLAADNDKEREWYRLLVAEESSNKYNDTTGVSLPDPKYSSLPNPAGIPNNVTDLNLTEMTSACGFYIAFNIPQNDLSFHHADVFLSMDNSNWWLYRSNIGSRSNLEFTGARPGQTYYVKVIAYNRFGGANPSPEMASILITNVSFLPPIVHGLRLDGEASLNTTFFTKRDAKFVWRGISTTSGAGNTPAGQEGIGAGEYSGTVVFKYWIEIWVSGSSVRKEIINDTFYTYTYEKNYADNGTASNTFTIKVWGYNEAANLKSLNPATLTVTNPPPSTVTGLTAPPWMRGVRFEWARNPEIDISHYTYRIKVESDAWSSWTEAIHNFAFRGLTDAEVTSHGGDATIYIEVKAVDTFGQSSSEAAALNGDCLWLNIEPTDINDFAITASKIFTNIPVLESDSWSDDSPGAGSVAWNEHTIYYAGVGYTIAAGDTDKKYIYWESLNSNYTASDTNPVLGDGEFIIAVNINGAHDLAWNAIANQVIGSAYIQDLAVVTAKINDLAVTSAKINDLAVITAKIDDLAVTNAKINDLNASKINAGYLHTDRLEAGSITATLIAANTLTASLIAAHTITADQIAFNTLTASLIGANKIITASANIEDAIITGAKIGNLEVDTLQIAENAVTIPVSNYAEAATTVASSANEDVISASITSTGAPIVIIASCTCSAPDIAPEDAGNIIFGIQRGSTNYASFTAEFLSTSPEIIIFCGVFSETPGSGSITYDLNVENNTGVQASITNKSIVLLEVKK
uniref:Putative tail protein n=1 Tax=viral metagenome TaxID=1070528 RepID=A0A6M3IVS2_9ZZZZ